MLPDVTLIDRDQIAFEGMLPNTPCILPIYDYAMGFLHQIKLQKLTSCSCPRHPQEFRLSIETHKLSVSMSLDEITSGSLNKS